jgi:hypothetical protein
LFHLVLESHDGRAPGADSEEKHEPVSDIDTVVVDSLKALDPEWMADMNEPCWQVAFVPITVSCTAANDTNRLGLFDHLIGKTSGASMGSILIHGSR